MKIFVIEILRGWDSWRPYSSSLYIVKWNMGHLETKENWKFGLKCLDPCMHILIYMHWNENVYLCISMNHLKNSIPKFRKNSKKSKFFIFIVSQCHLYLTAYHQFLAQLTSVVDGIPPPCNNTHSFQRWSFKLIIA